MPYAEAEKLFDATLEEEKTADMLLSQIAKQLAGMTDTAAPKKAAAA